MRAPVGATGKAVIALIQRVTQASVRVDGEIVGEIGPGLLALVAVVEDDTEAQADRLVERLLGYRVFPDDQGRMNLSLSDTGGGLLLVPQFTLAADTNKGMRPSFGPAASPARGQTLFEYLLGRARARHRAVATGVFGAHMAVALVNDGPVTFRLEAPPTRLKPRSRGRA
jgi:D-tyrosyl-tRNA(Tyr) deacylase